MARRRIRRLPVVQGKKLIGLLSDTDLLMVSSELSEILRDIIRQNNPEGEFAPNRRRLRRRRNPSIFIQGICEVCQRFKESLENINGTYVCNSCREELPLYQ